MSQLNTPKRVRVPGSQLTRIQKRNLVAVGLGNLLEWFDWNIYATFAVYIAANYFNDESPTSALLLTLAVFAVGFVARPFGGLLFGRITDKAGRKFAMMLSVSIMTVASLVIAICPSYQTIGAWASVILLAARLAQGVSQGGETPASYAFLSEIAPAPHRGRWSSLIYVSGVTGNLLTIVMAVILNNAFTAQQMNDFGWRIPFFVGAALGLYTLIMRRTMQESDVFVESRASGVGNPGVLHNVASYRRELMTIIGLTVGFTTAYYAWVINIPTYANVGLGYDRGMTLWASAIGNVCLILSLPLWGMLSDRVGRRPVLGLGFASIFVLYVPGFLLVKQGVVWLVVSLIVMSVLLGAIAAIFPATIAEMLPTAIRGTGIGFPYALAVALFGGTAPYIQQVTATLDGAGVALFPAYVMSLVAVSLLMSRRIAETKGRPLLD